VINLGGGFTGVEGGNRPAFNSGGTQEDRIRNIKGGGDTWVIGNTLAVSGAFTVSGAQAYGRGTSSNLGQLGFDASRSVGTDHVGDDNAPINTTIRLLMRQS
jgi:hypothetical protein